MKNRTLRLLKRTCWIMVAVVAALHIWADGRTIDKQQALRKQGVAQEKVWEEAPFHCGTLNSAFLLFLVGALVLGPVERAATKKTREAVEDASVETHV